MVERRFTELVMVYISACTHLHSPSLTEAHTHTHTLRLALPHSPTLTPTHALGMFVWTHTLSLTLSLSLLYTHLHTERRSVPLLRFFLFFPPLCVVCCSLVSLKIIFFYFFFIFFTSIYFTTIFPNKNCFSLENFRSKMTLRRCWSDRKNSLVIRRCKKKKVSWLFVSVFFPANKKVLKQSSCPLITLINLFVCHISLSLLQDRVTGIGEAPLDPEFGIFFQSLVFVKIIFTCAGRLPRLARGSML